MLTVKVLLTVTMLKNTKAKLTKTEVDKHKPDAKDYYVWDTETLGFGLRVWPSGTKTYVLQYRTPENRQRLYTIGRHGQITADQARSRAADLCAEIRIGKNPDPLGHQQKRRSAINVAELLDAYVSSAKFAEKTTETQTYDKGRIKNHLKPLMGKIIADQLKPEQVRKAFADIRDGKTAQDIKTGTRGRSIVKGGEGSARMAIRLLRTALNWAVEEGFIPDNPAKKVKIGNDEVRTVILEDTEQYKRMFETLNKMEQEQRIRPEVADAFRVIALTGARKGEVAKLTWGQVDLKRGVLTFSARQHKTGKSTGEAKEIGLPAMAQAIIAKRPVGRAGDYVFPPAHGEGPLSLSKPWLALREEAGLPEKLGIHGLRHSLASMMAVNGAQAAELMTALGHKQLATTKRYIHFAENAKAALMEKHTAGIAAAMSGNNKTAEVVDIKIKRENE